MMVLEVENRTPSEVVDRLAGPLIWGLCIMPAVRVS